MITSSIITLIFTRGQNKKFEDMPRRTNARGREQFLQAEAKDKISASTRDQLVLEDLTSLLLAYLCNEEDTDGRG